MNVEKLYKIVEECIASSEMFYAHRLKEHKSHYTGDTYDNWQHWYGIYEAEINTNWYRLQDVCEMLSLDMDILVSTVKSIRRQERKIKWERCFNIRKVSDEFIDNISVVDCLKLSTFGTPWEGYPVRRDTRKMWERFICLGVKRDLP